MRLRDDIYILVITLFIWNCQARSTDYDYRSLLEDAEDFYKRETYEPDSMSRELSEQLSSIPSNGELFEEDIIMDERLRRNVLNAHKRTSLKYDDIRWPGGVLIYEIDPSFAPCARKLLKIAIKEYEKRTGITFKLRTNEKDWVLYTSEENTCSSNIGRIGGRQKIYIGHSCCVLGTVLHETMHALGFIHEHSRHDRDDFVNIMWDNISESKEVRIYNVPLDKERNNFNKYAVSDTTDNDVAYNLASVMHYRNDAFTTNGKDTISVYEEPGLKFGQRIKFSVGDVQGINKFYNCPQKSDSIYVGLFKVYSGKKAEERKRKKEQMDHLRKNRELFKLLLQDRLKK